MGKEMKEWIIVRSQEELGALVPLLLKLSCWFEVTPLPCDLYEVKTKMEGHFRRMGIAAERVKRTRQRSE